MRIAGERLGRYGDAVDRVAEAAGEAAAGALGRMRAESPGASVAEVREAAIAVVGAARASYGEAAGELAATLYDQLAFEAGADVPPAAIADADEEDLAAVERRVRYLVGALVPDREDI